MFLEVSNRPLKGSHWTDIGPDPGDWGAQYPLAPMGTPWLFGNRITTFVLDTPSKCTTIVRLVPYQDIVFSCFHFRGIPLSAVASAQTAPAPQTSWPAAALLPGTPAPSPATSKTPFDDLSTSTPTFLMAIEKDWIVSWVKSFQDSDQLFFS